MRGWRHRMMGRLRRRKHPPQPAESELLTRFGRTCPVCAAVLGGSVPRDGRTGRFEVSPTARLRVGQADGYGRYPWQIELVEGDYPPASSTNPAFSTLEVDYVYLLCGGGHIFPDAAPLLHGGHTDASDPRERIDVWNMIAAIGGPASGKTYLLLRTLNQSLDNYDNLTFDDAAPRIQLRALSPLEMTPLQVRTRLYAQTLSSGHFIPATGTDTRATPAGILLDELPDAHDAMQELVRRTVRAGEQRADNWGRGMRQPLVLRADVGPSRTWTGVADLPGEMFSSDTDNRRESVKLRAYDALVWVVDPAVAVQAAEWLGVEDEESHSLSIDLLEGSLRPGATRQSNARVVRTTRDQIQRDIGRELTKVDGLFTTERGSSLEMLIAITKCDLIREALSTRALQKLGEERLVLDGAKAYLLFLAARWTQQMTTADDMAGEVLAFIHGTGTARQSDREARAAHVAEGLLDHYSNDEAFWNLAHEGAADLVRIRGRNMNLAPLDIEVPAIGPHIDGSMLAGSAPRMLTRDLVMSTVGCGLAYGLGLRGPVYNVLNKQWQHIRFFLCSPLATLPVAKEDKLKPMHDKDRFPRVDDRSAALTQLLLAMLGKVRA